MKKVSSLILSLSLSVAFCLHGFAQASPPDPQDVVLKYFECLKSGDYTQAVACMDVDAVNSLKQILLPIALSMANSEKGKPMVQSWFGTSDPTELTAMPVQDFANKFITFMCTSQHMKESLEASKIEFLGRVPEAGDLLHFVYRITNSSTTGGLTKVDIISVHKRGDVYGVLPTGNFIAFVQHLKGLFSQ
jgi:hypothetical protein